MQSGTLDDLRTTTRTAIEVTTKRPIDGLDVIEGVHSLHTEGAALSFEVDNHALDLVMSHLSAFGIRSLVSQPPTLEELFLREYATDAASVSSDGSST